MPDESADDPDAAADRVIKVCTGIMISLRPATEHEAKALGLNPLAYVYEIVSNVNGTVIKY